MSRPAVHADSTEAPAVEATPDRAAAQRNYLLGSLNGVIGAVSMDLLHPELILAGLVMALTGSYWMVALVTIINKAGSLVPQLYVGSFLEHRPRKRPFFIALIFVRVAAVTVILASIRLMVDPAWWPLAIFFAAYLVWCVCGGAGHVIFLDMVGRLIPIGRVGSFFGIREFWGGILSLLAGWLVIQPILESNRDLMAQAAAAPAEVRPAAGQPPGETPGPAPSAGAASARPQAGAASAPAAPGRPVGKLEAPAVRTRVAGNYLLLASVGGGLSVFAMSLLALCREVAGPRAKRPTTVTESLRRGLRWLRDSADYRAYLWLRIAFRFTYLGLAFFIPFGVARLRYEAHPLGVVALGGVMLATIKASRVVSSVLWGRVVDRAGDRVCLIGSGVFFTLGPILMLAAPLLPGCFSLPVPLTQAVLDLPLCVYLVALAAIGAAFQGSIIGGNRFLITSAPPHRRISYVGFLNTVTSPLTLLPFAAAYVAQAVGMTALFALIAAGGVLYLFWALRLSPDKPPPEPESPDVVGA